MENEDLHDLLFNPGGGMQQQNLKPTSHHGNIYTSPSPLNNIHPNQFQNKSNNKTREDLEALIEGIPFPNDDLSFTSFNSGHSSNTPQKFNPHYQTQNSNHHHQNVPDDRKPPTLKAPKGFSNENRQSQSHFPGHHKQKGSYLDFNRNNNYEENPKAESLSDWTKHHVTPSTSNMLFPQVTAPTMEITGEGSFSQSIGRKGPFGFGKSSVNQNNHISIDDLDDKEIENEEPSTGVDNARVLSSVGDSLLRIEAKRCQDQLATVESELVFQKKKYTKLEQENNYLTQRMNDLEDQLQFVQEKYNDHSSLDTLRGRNLANAKTQLKQVKGLLEKKEEKVEELALQVQQLKKNEQIYKEAVEKEISNLKLEIERGKILVKANQDKANELELKQKETFESNMMVEHQKDHIIENLKSQVEDQRERIEELKSHVQKNKGTMEKLAMHVHEREELLNKATEELEEKEKEVEMLKKQNENFLMDQHRLTNLESDKVWEQKYSALNDELVRIKSEKDREIMRLKEMTARMKEQLRIAEETIIKKDEEINMSMAQGRPSARNFNVLDSLLEGDGNRAKDDELRNQKAHYERQISLYRSQIEELNQKLAAFENEVMFSGRNPQAHYSRLSVGSTRDDKMTISQSTNCTLYLEPLNNLMSALKIYNSGSSDVNYEEELGRVLDHFNQLTSRAQSLEKTIVEFKKKQISVNSELDCVKMENDQLKETLGDMQEKEAENAEKIISLHSEIADLKKTVISLESQTRTGSLFGGSPRSTRSRRDNDLFKDHDEENLQEHLQLKEDYKTLESEYGAARDNVKKLQMKCKELELELKRASSQNERSQNELELIKVELETKSTNERNHWEGIRKGLNERIKGLETKNESIMEEVRKRDLTIAELQGKLEVAEVESKTSRKDVSYASESGINKDVLSNRVTQLERRNKDLDSELQEKEEEINNFRLMLKEANYELEQEKTGNAENLKRLQNKVRSLEEDVANYKHESETLAEQLNRLNEILEKRDVELNRVLNEKQALQLENERLGMGLDKEKSREDVLGKMNDALSNRDKQLIELKGKVEDLTFELKKEKEKNQKLRETENGRERQLEDITSRLKEKENEIKYVVESAKKKETHDAKTTTELNTKKQEFEKLQAAHSQLEKELDAIKKERNELKKTSETAQKSLEKLEAEMKRKEESLKQVDEKTKRDAQYLKDKDKANLELFKVNKNLTENLKTLEETHNTLKTELEKKNKTLAQKLSEIKGLTQSNKKFEESNQELTNEVMDLKVQLQQLENEIANKKVQALKNENLDESLSRYIDDKEVTRETTRTAATKRETEQDGGKSNRQEIEKLLQSFSEKEAQFENIKNSFIEKMMGLSEKCTSLAEENSFLSQKIELYQASNETLKDKVTKLEKNIKQGTTWTPFNDSGIEFNKMDTRTDPLASLRKTQGALEEYDDDGYALDELKPPRDYDANPMKYASYNKNDYDMKSTVNRYDEKATTNVFNNNILEMISPEMLSTDETVSLMLEVLRRASQSHDLAVTIGTNREFKELTNAIRKQCTLEEQNVYAYENNNNVSFSGKIRRQNRHNESYYSYSKQG